MKPFLLLLSLLLLKGLLPLSTGWLQAQENEEILGEDETVGIIRLSDMGTNEVLDMLENFTDKAVLRQQNLPTVKINFSSVSPMTKEEAILALESLLSLNGIAITELGEKFLKAVPTATVTTQVPRLIDTSTLPVPASQKIYSKFFRLNYLTTTEAIPLIQPLLSLGAPIAFDKTNSVMITDALINLQRVEGVLGKIDQPAEVDVEILFFQLDHIPASEMVQRLQATQTGSLRRFLENNTTFDADDRTNQLIIFTHPSNTDLITSFINKLDIDIAPRTQTEIFYLRHADATEVTSLIEQVVSGQQSDSDASRTRPGRPSAPGQPPQTPQQTQTPTQPRRPTAVAVSNTTENLQFSEFMRIIADPRANSIVAYGTPDDVRYLSELIEKIDILLAQVRIEVVIAEVGLTTEDRRGIDEFNVDFNADGDFEIDVGVQGQGFSYEASLKDFSMSSVFATARSKNNVKVLNAPTIMTTHNQEANIIVAEQRPLITATQTDTTGGALRSTVQFRDIGLELTVTPLIGANGIIQMEITQTVEAITGEVLVDGNEQPIIGRREATSFISVADGEMIVLGGLESLTSSDNKTRIAIFGGIPILGPLFGAHTEDALRRELIFFIQPRVITTTAEANEDALEQIEKIDDREEVDDYLEEGTFFPDRPEKKKTLLQRLWRRDL